MSESSGIACSGVTAGYGSLAAIRDVSLTVRPGEIVALLGANGSGKTTTLLALTGELPLTAGVVTWQGKKIRPRLDWLARHGLAWVPDERGVFRTLSVRDNLSIGRGSVEDALSIFPELEPLEDRLAGLLSGGEQQMLTLARALAASPAVLLLDELTLGLSPVIADRLFAKLADAVKQQQMAVLLVEQQARRVLSIADRWYGLANGRVVASGTQADSQNNESEIRSLYLGGEQHNN